MYQEICDFTWIIIKGENDTIDLQRENKQWTIKHVGLTSS